MEPPDLEVFYGKYEMKIRVDGNEVVKAVDFLTDADNNITITL